MDTPEIRFDMYCDDTVALTDIHHQHEDVDLEIESGLGGFEIVGTLVIPGVALALQVFSLIRDLKKEEHPSLVIKNVHIHIGDKVVVVKNPTPAEVERKLLELQD